MNKYNVALIDDDTSALSSIKYCLESDFKDDVNFFSYSTGETFLSDLTNKKFHLVVTDLEMPKVSGVQIIQAIKTMHKNLPIIVLTGNTEILRKNFDIQKFIFEILIKPVEYINLYRSIKDGLICHDFYNPPVSSKDAIDDSKASKKLILEVMKSNYIIRNKIFSEDKNSKKEILAALDSQEKLLNILKNSF